MKIITVQEYINGTILPIGVLKDISMERTLIAKRYGVDRITYCTTKDDILIIAKKLNIGESVDIIMEDLEKLNDESNPIVVRHIKGESVFVNPINGQKFTTLIDSILVYRMVEVYE